MHTDLKPQSTKSRFIRSKRLLWLMAIYLLSIVTLAAVAGLFRLLMTAAGMKSH